MKPETTIFKEIICNAFVSDRQFINLLDEQATEGKTTHGKIISAVIAEDGNWRLTLVWDHP